MPETMTSLERVLAVLSHQVPDRVPVCPVLLMQGAAEVGLELKEYFANGEHLARGQLALLEKYGHDCVIGVPHVVQDTTAFGCGLLYFRSGPPSVDRMAIKSYAEIESLGVPDPLAQPLLQETLRALRLLAGKVKGRVPILGAAIAPFSLPSMLMGTEKWMDLFFMGQEGRQWMQAILRITIPFVVSWANAQLEAGADAIVLADGMASAAVITEEEFLAYALPVVQATIRQIHGPVIYEGVGSLEPFIVHMPKTGAVGVILDCHDDIAASKSRVAGQLAILGNLNNIEMRRWTPQQMEDAVRKALAAGMPGGGYILGTQGPEIPLGVSDEVIRAMVESVRREGQY